MKALSLNFLKRNSQTEYKKVDFISAIIFFFFRKKNNWISFVHLRRELSVNQFRVSSFIYTNRSAFPYLEVNCKVLIDEKQYYSSKQHERDSRERNSHPTLWFFHHNQHSWLFGDWKDEHPEHMSIKIQIMQLKIKFPWLNYCKTFEAK